MWGLKQLLPWFPRGGGYQIPPTPLVCEEIDTPWEIGLKEVISNHLLNIPANKKPEICNMFLLKSDFHGLRYLRNKTRLLIYRLFTIHFHKNNIVVHKQSDMVDIFTVPFNFIFFNINLSEYPCQYTSNCRPYINF